MIMIMITMIMIMGMIMIRIMIIKNKLLMIPSSKVFGNVALTGDP